LVQCRICISRYNAELHTVIPIGLGLSLILNSIFLAHKINAEKKALTLVDVLSKRYGKTVEVLVSLITITSFIMLLAGNLVGMGFVCAYVWGTSQEAGIWIAASIIWAYTVGGGYVGFFVAWVVVCFTTLTRRQYPIL
jgi:Na+/proline symporter